MGIFPALGAKGARITPTQPEHQHGAHLAKLPGGVTALTTLCGPSEMAFCKEEQEEADGDTVKRF